jgi:hypothetical protein
VQANVSGIDARRTDVVTVTAAAALRPDITVASVAGIAQAVPHSEVTFVATVSELNGDVGARSNCVLSIDGTAIDQADGIWVDAGGTVSCMFSVAFDAPGAYAVAVSAAGINPGDWDTSNNSAFTSITIVRPGVPLQLGYMSASQIDHQDGTERWNSVYDLSQSEVQTDKHSEVYFAGTSNELAAGGLQVLDVTLSADGVVNHTASLTRTSTSDYDDGWSWSHCEQHSFDYWDGTHHVSSGDLASTCTYGDSWGQSTYYRYQRLSGQATYYGIYSQYGGSFSYNGTTTYGSGADYGWTPGTNVRLQLNFVDAAGAGHTADRTVTLEAYPPYNYDYSSSDGVTYGFRSWSSHSTAVGVTQW